MCLIASLGNRVGVEGFIELLIPGPGEMFGTVMAQRYDGHQDEAPARPCGLASEIESTMRYHILFGETLRFREKSQAHCDRMPAKEP